MHSGDAGSFGNFAAFLPTGLTIVAWMSFPDSSTRVMGS
jgi:hypothetical protein